MVALSAVAVACVPACACTVLHSCVGTRALYGVATKKIDLRRSDYICSRLYTAASSLGVYMHPGARSLLIMATMQRRRTPPHRLPGTPDYTLGNKRCSR